MDWLLKFTVIWISIDIVIAATIWYGISTIRPRYPNWWRRVVVDDEPEYHRSTKSLW